MSKRIDPAPQSGFRTGDRVVQSALYRRVFPHSIHRPGIVTGGSWVRGKVRVQWEGCQARAFDIRFIEHMPVPSCSNADEQAISAQQ